MLVSELADERGDVREVVAVVDLGGGGSGSRLGLRSFLFLFLRLRLLLLGLFFSLGFFLGFGLFGRGGVGVADAGDDGADFDGVVFLSEDFDEGAGDRGRDFGVDLVGGDLE